MIALLSRGAYYSAARAPKTDWHGLGRSCTNISYAVGVHRASVHYPNLKIWVVAKMWPKSLRRWRPCRFAPSSVEVTSFPVRNDEKLTSGLKSESNLHMCSSIEFPDPVRSRSTVWEEFSPNGPNSLNCLVAQMAVVVVARGGKVVVVVVVVVVCVCVRVCWAGWRW